MGKLGEEAEGMSHEAAAGLGAFSDALRTASEQLSGQQQSLAGDVVSQAAGGLEQLARWLDGRSPREMIDGMRSFGRQNPAAFAAGSVLAGFALGRLAAAMPRASEPHRRTYSPGAGNPDRPSYSPGAGKQDRPSYSAGASEPDRQGYSSGASEPGGQGYTSGPSESDRPTYAPEEGN